MISLFVITLMWALPLCAEEDEEILAVTGVVLDTVSSDQSIAIVNGAPILAGDEVEGFRVLEIQSKAVVFQKLDSGEKVTVPVKVDKKPAAPAAEPLPMPEKVSFVDQFRSLWQDLWVSPSPKKISKDIPKGIETLEKAARNIMRKIYHAGGRYYVTRQRQPPDIQALILGGYLDKNYAEAVQADYRFYFDSNRENPGIHGDPLNSGAGLRYFFLDRGKRMHAESNRIATVQSPRL